MTLSIDCRASRRAHQPAHLRHRLRSAPRREAARTSGSSAPPRGAGAATRLPLQLGAGQRLEHRQRLVLRERQLHRRSGLDLRATSSTTIALTTSRPRSPCPSSAGWPRTRRRTRSRSRRSARSARPTRYRPDAGNGVSPTASPSRRRRRRAPASPAAAGVHRPLGRAPSASEDEQRGRCAACDLYILDNEPMLWNSHPPRRAPRAGRLRRAARAHHRLRRRPSAPRTRRRSSPGRRCGAGPPIFFSAKDAAAGLPARSRTGCAHGDVPLLALVPARSSGSTSRRPAHAILDVVDVHFYPQADRVGGRRRRRSTRPPRRCASAPRARSGTRPTSTSRGSADRVQLIPAPEALDRRELPRASGSPIGEWNFGAEQHVERRARGGRGARPLRAERRHVGLLLDLPARAARRRSGPSAHIATSTAKAGDFLDWSLPTQRRRGRLGVRVAGRDRQARRRGGAEPPGRAGAAGARPHRRRAGAQPEALFLRGGARRLRDQPRPA